MDKNLVKKGGIASAIIVVLAAALGISNGTIGLPSNNNETPSENVTAIEETVDEQIDYTETEQIAEEAIAEAEAEDAAEAAEAVTEDVTETAAEEKVEAEEEKAEAAEAVTEDVTETAAEDKVEAAGATETVTPADKKTEEKAAAKEEVKSDKKSNKKSDKKADKKSDKKADKKAEEKVDKKAAEVYYEFSSFRKLQEHFEKHGGDFDYANEKEYLEGANRVINNPNSLHKIEAEDGDDVYYLEETNEFVIVAKRGFIRTYYKPSGGLAYFNRQ